MDQEPQYPNFPWRLFFGAGSLFVAFFFYIIYKIIFVPLFHMHHYRKQGIPCTYFPIIGSYRSLMGALKKHGDATYYIKLQAKTSPKRVECSNLGTSVYLSLYDPVLIKEFYQNVDNYIKDPVFMELYIRLLGQGLLTSEGNQWKIQRKILSNCFHFEFLKSVIPNIQRTARQQLENIATDSLSNVNLLDAFQNITGEVVGKLFFGDQLNQYELDGQPLTIALTRLISDIGLLTLSAEKHLLGSWVIEKGIFPKHKKILETVKSMRTICSEIIEERKKQHSIQKDILVNRDMLDLLLEYSGEEGKMTDEEIVDQFVTFFLAGMDTTGHLALMAVYCLHKYPKYKIQMIEEVNTYYENDVTIESLNKLEFTLAFIRETLRTMSPVPGTFPRMAVRDHMIKDISVKKGDLILLNYFYNNFDPKYFDEVHTFDPMRWMDKTRSIQAYAFTPFSAGPRNCIGQHLALIEARIILAEFLRMYDFSVKKDAEIKFDFKFLYEPLDPILFDLTHKDTIMP